MRRTAFYSSEETYQNFPDDAAAITYRGPFFKGSYDRYQFSVPGMTPFITVIAPKSAAVGRPWVYRAGYVRRDAQVDVALLAKGFHIVTGPVPYNADGPQLEQWNAVYHYLVEHGFSAKPAMEGSDAGAGEVIAWAIANPDKVACVYAENPFLGNHMLNQPLIVELEPLAKAGVPLFHACGSLDPLLEHNTRAMEKRYGELGGKITVEIEEDEGHGPLVLKDPQAAVDFIVRSATK
jgi:hypothetical protein